MGIANLHGANLLEANLHGANLHGANLLEANLSKANLSWVQKAHQAYFLETVQFRRNDTSNIEPEQQPPLHTSHSFLGSATIAQFLRKRYQ